MNNSFEIEEVSFKNKKMITVNKKLLILVAVVVVVLLTVLPIVTYFSKSCKVSSNENIENVTTKTTTTTTTVPELSLSYRIPSNLIPYKYEIKINAENISSTNPIPEYKGIVDIYFTCKVATKKLIFHIRNIEIDNSTLLINSTNINGFTAIKSPAWRNDFEREFFVLDSVSDLEFKKDQNYSIHIEYTGYLKTDNIGFYRSSYVKNNNLQLVVFKSI